jgi:hypothetical protein
MAVCGPKHACVQNNTMSMAAYFEVIDMQVHLCKYDTLAVRGVRYRVSLNGLDVEGYPCMHPTAHKSSLMYHAHVRHWWINY